MSFDVTRISRCTREGVSFVPGVLVSESRSAISTRLSSWLLVAFFLSGGVALIYQVLWTRQLGHVFGVTIQAASTVLACFMAGLAIGSYLAGR